METEPIYKKINEEKLKAFVNNCFHTEHGNDCPSHNISVIHPQCNIFYNSLNVCIGKPGAGKTCFLMMELMKIAQVEGHKYRDIIYISHTDGGVDATFAALRKAIGHDIYGVDFWKATPQLDEYFKRKMGNPDDTSHTMIIVEDATFLFSKPSEMWMNWIIRLRHLRCTMWLNVHQWKSLNMFVRAQITTLFIFPGYSSLEVANIFRQLVTPIPYKDFIGRYSQLQGRQLVFISCQPPVNQDGNAAISERIKRIDLNPKGKTNYGNW